MIQPNELRIGNYIKSDNGIICEVSRIESKEFTKWDSGEDNSILCKVVGTKDDYLNCINDNWKPIPITEEILLKCGFFYDCDSDTYKIPDCSLQIDLSDFYIPEAVVFGESLRYIKYLHQLQNLYFSLIGTELKIKGHYSPLFNCYY